MLGNIIIILDLVEHNQGDPYDHLMSMRIFTLIMNKIFIPDDDRGCRLSSQGSPGLYLGRYLQIFGEQVSGKYSSKSEQESVAQVKVAHKAQPR